MPKPFPAEFRRDVVAVARSSGEPIAKVAKDFGISASCLQRWLAQDDVDDGRGSGPSRQESEEVRELKRRNRILEQENEILRRAAAYFAKEISPK